MAIQYNTPAGNPKLGMLRRQKKPGKLPAEPRLTIKTCDRDLEVTRNRMCNSHTIDQGTKITSNPTKGQEEWRRSSTTCITAISLMSLKSHF